ncbi:Hypothetical predicted protein [Cloeon dipterum]|uniref:UBA domain-containing protein n=1 Tax=Cloeon dipterum TaxID=197152 RepID=A0A8S1CQW7_9INSE|nr:Hypothetical predicted protein [Cloeon dipterum]
MAAILSQYSTTGFYKAPVSKALMGSVFLACTALNTPALAHLRPYLLCRIPEAFSEPWRLLLSRLTFLDTKDLVCGSVLIYYFRIFERRFGSHKFSSYLLATGLLATLFEVAVVSSIRQFGLHDGLLPPGPYCLIFPLFVNFFFDIPRIVTTHVVGIPITGKTLTYILGLQVCSTSSANAVTALCGIAAGLVWRSGALNWLRLPSFVARACDLTIGRLLRSQPPSQGALGATLELQRQQQMELLEQQLQINRARDHRTRHGQGYAETLVGPDHHGWQPNQNEAQQAGLNAAEQQEEQVARLVDMGFDRESVVNALRAANNDLNTATNLLLQEG